MSVRVVRIQLIAPPPTPCARRSEESERKRQVQMLQKHPKGNQPQLQTLKVALHVAQSLDQRGLGYLGGCHRRSDRAQHL